MRVLLVEDDPAIASALVEGLPRYGFEAVHLDTGAAALDALEREGPWAVVLLDLGLPDIDGIDVCRSVRARSNVPLIIITARSEEVERVVGLELGADDYVSKPFGLRELVARMRAVLRRAGAVDDPSAGEQPGGEQAEAPQASSRGPQAPAPLAVGGRLEVAVAARRVRVDGGEVALTPKEFDLLVELARRPGQVAGREELLARVWDVNWFGSTRTLDVHVGSLRRKLLGAVEIQTVRGVGFRLEAGS